MPRCHLCARVRAVDALLTSLKVDPLILNAVVSGTGMHEDGADVSALPSSTGVHESHSSVSGAVDIEARQSGRSGLRLRRSVSMYYSLAKAVDDLPDYVESSGLGSQDRGSVGCSEGSAVC